MMIYIVLVWWVNVQDYIIRVSVLQDIYDQCVTLSSLVIKIFNIIDIDEYDKPATITSMLTYETILLFIFFIY